MAAITYTAIDRGDLVSGHSELTEYSFDVPIESFQKSIKREQSTVSSLSGKRFTSLMRLDVFYSAKTVPTDDQSTIDNMREFLSSVAAGETFTIDLFGSVSTPDNPVTFKLDGDTGEDLNIISYSFSFKVVKS